MQIDELQGIIIITRSPNLSEHNTKESISNYMILKDTNLSIVDHKITIKQAVEQDWGDDGGGLTTKP